MFDKDLMCVKKKNVFKNNCYFCVEADESAANLKENTVKSLFN